jgi:hypothetical protein
MSALPSELVIVPPPLPQSSRLSEDEVRERLKLCEDPNVVDEIYEFGKILGQEVIDQIKVLESKATSFAAYGAAIVTLLVSSSSTWSNLGNQWSPWIAVCVGICGLVCTCLAVGAMSLKKFECISEDEWLKRECLGKITTLKRYRILTMWGTIESHGNVQREKAAKVRKAEVWLTGSVIYLVYLLLHIAFVRSLSDHFWIAVGQCAIHNPLGIPGWQRLLSSPGVLGGLLSSLILGLTLILIFWRSQRLI